MSNATIGAVGSADKNTQHTRKVGAIFSGANSSGGGDDVGSAHKVEPAGKDSVHLSDEARGKE